MKNRSINYFLLIFTLLLASTRTDAQPSQHYNGYGVQSDRLDAWSEHTRDESQQNAWCSCSMTNPDVDECDLAHPYACSNAFCYNETTNTNTAECHTAYNGPYCGCKFVCITENSSGKVIDITTEFVGKASTPQTQCISSTVNNPDGTSTRCTHLPMYKRNATEPGKQGGYQILPCY